MLLGSWHSDFFTTMSEKEKYLSSKGRPYVKGRPIGNELRELILSDMMKNGANMRKWRFTLRTYFDDC